MAFYLLWERKIKNIKINMLKILYLLLEVIVIIVPVLLAVAFMTIIERKALASFQRRVGPNTVGYYGVLQPLKLLGGKFYKFENKTIC